MIYWISDTVSQITIGLIRTFPDRDILGESQGTNILNIAISIRKWKEFRETIDRDFFFERGCCLMKELEIYGTRWWDEKYFSSDIKDILRRISRKPIVYSIGYWQELPQRCNIGCQCVHISRPALHHCAKSSTNDYSYPSALSYCLMWFDIL